MRVEPTGSRTVVDRSVLADHCFDFGKCQFELRPAVASDGTEMWCDVDLVLLDSGFPRL
jgi:hypothetical protein